MIESLPPIDHARRIESVQQELSSNTEGYDAWLVTDLYDIRWLTGFVGSNGWAIVRPDGVTLGTDGRYAEKARAETAAAGVEIVAAQNGPKLHAAMVRTLRGARGVGLDDRTTPVAVWRQLAADVPLLAWPSSIMVRRQVKDAAEIARIEAAAAIADAALVDVEPNLCGMTELEVRAELEYLMVHLGADDRSYHTIVASGPEHGARPHHGASRREIVEGDTVIIDVGALVDGYHSDMTRSWVIGEPTARQRDIYELVGVAQQAGLDAVRPGVDAALVDAACRTVFEDAGYLDWYVHGTGHGVGLEIHEPPFHSPTSVDSILTDYVVTVEPGLYRGGFGGFRIEDLVLVTDDEPGHRMLTHSPKRELN